MPTTGNPTADALLIYGPIGVLLVLFILGWVIAKPVFDPVVKRERDLTNIALANNAKLAESIDRIAAAVLRDRAGV